MPFEGLAAGEAEGRAKGTAPSPPSSCQWRAMAAAAEAILGSLHVVWQAEVQSTAELVIHMDLADVCTCPVGN